MSQQQGGSGYNKFKKDCQTGGASGWAKHCGDTQDHKLSNRLERKRRAEFDEELPRVPSRRKNKAKVPTRRHLLDKLKYLDSSLAKYEEGRRKHKESHADCKCWAYSEDRWYFKWIARDRAKVLAEMKKHGYEVPEGQGRLADPQEGPEGK